MPGNAINIELIGIIHIDLFRHHAMFYILKRTSSRTVLHGNHILHK